MTEQPDVSVIVAAYNGMPYLERMLASLKRQTIGLDRMQVIVVDDGSTDETPAVLDRTAADHPSFEVIHQANFGRPAGPRNRALGMVRGRYVFFLDQDDYLADDALEAMVRVADDNGTDVVLGRIKGVGGRGTPRTMFGRTMPRTDVFSSSAYWSLNPLKLFRAETVRSLGLRFAEDLPWGEDQPFVAIAYLKGEGISILADKDYLFWVYREDRSNITTSAIYLADRMPVVDRMFDLVAANVAPGPQRDGLMQRHFRIEMADSAFEGYRMEKDPDARAAAFGRFEQIVDAYFNEGIEATLPPADRVLIRLVSEGRAEEFGAYLDELQQAAPPTVLSEGERLYLRLPWFRDPGKRLPDPLFDYTTQLRVECRLEPLAAGGDGVRFAAVCRLGALTDRVTDVALVVSPDSGQAGTVIPLAYAVSREEVRPFVAVEDTLAVDRLLASLPSGAYHLYVRVGAGTTVREHRLAECAEPRSGSTLVHLMGHGRPAAKSGVLRTWEGGSLTLRVIDGVAADVRLRGGPAGPGIDVKGLPPAAGSGAPVVLRLVGPDGSAEPPLLADRCEDGERALSFDARGLASGTYSMQVGLPDAGEAYPLMMLNAAHRLDRTTDGGGQLRIKGSELVVVGAWEYLAERVRARARRLFGRDRSTAAKH